MERNEYTFRITATDGSVLEYEHTLYNDSFRANLFGLEMLCDRLGNNIVEDLMENYCFAQACKGKTFTYLSDFVDFMLD